jgi:tetratricopeptide (TPR) repeat protein
MSERFSQQGHKQACRRSQPGARLALLCTLMLASALQAGAQTKPKTQSKAKSQSPPATSEEQAQAKLEALLKESEDALNKSDYPAAVKSLKAVVDIQPDLAPAWFSLGYAYTGLHENDDAVAAYRKALGLKPDLFEARINLGILLVEMNRPKEALEHLEKAAALKPQNARPHLYYARALAAAGQTDAAQKEFQETLKLDPKSAMAHFDLGQIELNQKQFEGARAEFEKAAGLDGRLAQALLGEALALEGLKRTADAAPYFEKYLAAKPDDLETRFHLAKINLEQGKNEEALADLQKVYQAKPRLAGLAAALGDVYALLKKLPESEKFYREALAATPDESDLHRALGKTLLDEGEFGPAEAEFRAALKLDPQNREALHGLAATLYSEKRFPETIPLLEASTHEPNPPAEAFFLLATCYDHLRVNQKALEAYERFLDLAKDPNSDQVWQAQQRAKLLRRMLEK